MEDLLSIFVNSVFVGNILLSYFLGMCSFIAVSNTMDTSIGLVTAGMLSLAFFAFKGMV